MRQGLETELQNVFKFTKHPYKNRDVLRVMAANFLRDKSEADPTVSEAGASGGRFGVSGEAINYLIYYCHILLLGRKEKCLREFLLQVPKIAWLDRDGT